MAERILRRDNLHYVAEAGIKRLIMELSKGDILSPNALKDSWSNNKDIFKDIAVGSGEFRISYDYAESSLGFRGAFFGAVDEERKINLNTADLETLKRLFNIVGLDEMAAQDLAASIVDWRDSDSQLSAPQGSAEDNYYRDLPEPYEAKDADFEAFPEILLVKGVTCEIFDKVKDFITIYGGGAVNINTASSEVLIALGLDEALVNKIILFRCGDDKIPGSADDNVFADTSEVVSRLSQAYQLSESDAARLSNFISSASIAAVSNNFTIKSTARFHNNDAFKHQIICVVTAAGEILYYAEL